MAAFYQLSLTALVARQVAGLHLRISSNVSRGALDAADKPYRQALHNHGDVQYTGDIQVGSQKLRGILDTGSFELLVLSKECEACGDTTKLYNHASSHHYRKGEAVAQHNFGSGVTFSNEAFDTVRAGPLVASKQHFWEVFDARMPILAESTFQAIVGVGPPDSAGKLAEDTPGEMMAVATGFDSLPARGDHVKPDRKEDPLSICTKFGVRAFSVCIGRTSMSPGYFIWNDRIQDQQATFTRVPVMGDIHWATRLSDVRIGHTNREGIVSLGCSDGCAAVIDSGTSLIAAPTEVIAQVDRALDKLMDNCSNLGDMPDLVFSLGGHEFSLPPDAYIGQVVHSGKPALSDILHFRFRSRHYSCVPLFMDVDTNTQLGPMWILGLPFFRKYYTSFSFDASTAPVQKHLSIALADDECKPTDGNALLAESRSRRDMRPRTIDASELRVPAWAEKAMARDRFDV